MLLLPLQYKIYSPEERCRLQGFNTQLRLLSDQQIRRHSFARSTLCLKKAIIDPLHFSCNLSKHRLISVILAEMLLRESLYFPTSPTSDSALPC